MRKKQKMRKLSSYGKELILDLYDCDPKKFTRSTLRRYFRELCERIDMKRCDLHFWDDYGVPKKDRQTEPHLVGTSAIQFIMTSNVTVHTLDILKTAYLNIFSCKNFDSNFAAEFTRKFFKGKIATKAVVVRK